MRRRLAIFAMLIFCASAFGQSWSYSGNSICYNAGPGMVSCSTSGQLTQYASSQQQFAQAYAVGQEIGSVIGAVFSSWVEHRHRVNVERQQLREQLRAYLDANIELTEEQLRQSTELTVTLPKLAKLDTANAEAYNAQLESASQQIPAIQKVLADRLADRGSLLKQKRASDLMDSIAIERNLYEHLYPMLAKGYVFNQIVTAVTGYYESQHTPEIKEASQKTGST